MTSVHCAKNHGLKLSQQLFAMALHSAAGVISRWSNELIVLTVNEIREVPLEEICAELDVGDELLTMVVMNLQERISGAMVLALDESNARKLAASLLGREVVDYESEWSDLEKSALTETGNILYCAYMNALSHQTHTRLLPSTPLFIQDYGASVLQQALAAQAMTGDKVLVCRSGFRSQSEQLDWRVLFFPTATMQKKMEAMPFCPPTDTP